MVAADIVGYSRLIERDTLGTVLRIRAVRLHLIEPVAAMHRALIVRHAGDGVLIAFRDPASAVACAVAVQRGVRSLHCELPQDSRFEFRMGLDMAEALVVDGDLHGTGVNVAARLQALAEPGEIWLSGTVFDQVRHRTMVRCEQIGERQLKNIEKPVRVYRISADELAAAPTRVRRQAVGLVRLVQAQSVCAGE